MNNQKLQLFIIVAFKYLESKTYSQKNKSELLYEAIFNYDKNKLMKIIYIRHKPTKIYSDKLVQELIFEYNEKELLTKFKDNFITTLWAYDKNENPVSVKEYDNNGSYLREMSAYYKYDKYNNWTYKNIKTVINKVKKKREPNF